MNVELWSCWREKKDLRAYEMLINSYIPLVNLAVSRLSLGLPSIVDRDDLASFGRFGLMDAMNKFDYTRGLQFETYAMCRIRGAILDGLRANDSVPRSVRDKAKKVEEAYQVLEQKNMRAVTYREVSCYIGITENELAQILQDSYFANFISLDQSVQDQEEQSMTRKSLVISYHRSLDPQKALDEYVQKQLITEAVNKLTKKEKTVVSLFYYEELTLTEIAEVMGLSPSRISQLHSKAIATIRSILKHT